MGFVGKHGAVTQVMAGLRYLCFVVEAYLAISFPCTFTFVHTDDGGWWGLLLYSCHNKLWVVLRSVMVPYYHRTAHSHTNQWLSAISHVLPWSCTQWVKYGRINRYYKAMFSQRIGFQGFWKISLLNPMFFSHSFIWGYVHTLSCTIHYCRPCLMQAILLTMWHIHASLYNAHTLCGLLWF